MRLLFVAFGLAGMVFSSEAAFAKKVLQKTPARHVSSQVEVDPYAQIPVDALEIELDQQLKKNLKKSSRKGPHKAAHTLSLAYTAFINHHFSEAQALAKLAQSDEVFSDYSNWIQGSAFQEEAKASLMAKQPKQAGTFAQQAYERFRAIQNGDPYSVLVHEAPKQLGISELLWAQALAPSREALKHYQTAFEHLNQQHALAEARPEMVESFAKACSGYKNPVCEAWISKLAPGLDKESDEIETIAKLFPSTEERQKAPPVPPRATQAYKAPDLDTAALETLMVNVRDTKWTDAITKMKSFFDDFPRSSYRYRVRFALGLAYLQKSQKDDAKKEFESLSKEAPLTFYGLLSNLALGKSIDDEIDNSYPMIARRDVLMNPEEVFRLNRAEILLSEGANELAKLELRGILIRAGQSSPFLMYLAVLNQRAQDYPILFQILSELVQRSYPGIASQFGLQMIFPIAQLEAIKKFSKENTVDPILVMSLIKQESAFDVKASSGSGASGLMQLMPFTAIETIPGITREELIEAEANIRVGSKYLSKLLDRYKGNVVLALASYNAGPTTVDRWVRDGIQEKRNMIQFIEAIPFKETRDYVGSIIRNYYWYSKFLNHAQPVGLDYFWKPYQDLNKEVGAPQVPTVVPNLAPSPTPSPSPSFTKNSS